MSTKVLVCALLSACVAFAMAADGSWRTPNVLSGEGRTAYFDGLTWRLNDDGSLEGFVIARTGDGPERELGFRYRAARKAESAGAAKAGCRPLFSVHFGTLGMVLCRARSAADVEGLEGKKAEACKDFT